MAESAPSSNMERQHAELVRRGAADVAATEELADEVLKEVEALQAEEGKAGAAAPFCPIVYGSIAFKLKAPPKKPDDEPAVTPATHRWTLYVRGIDGSDISFAVRAVEFKLHETFPEPIRMVTEPPFEVSDEGWGEFEAQMTIHFRHESLHPVRIAHHLRLHPQPGQAASHPADAPVVHEFYDEVVFNHPDALPEAVSAALAKGPDPARAVAHPFAHHFRAEELTPEPDLAQLAAAQAFVAQETARLMERLVRADAEAVTMTRDLEALGWSTAKSTRASSGHVTESARRR